MALEYKKLASGILIFEFSLMVLSVGLIISKFYPGTLGILDSVSFFIKLFGSIGIFGGVYYIAGWFAEASRQGITFYTFLKNNKNKLVDAINIFVWGIGVTFPVNFFLLTTKNNEYLLIADAIILLPFAAISFVKALNFYSDPDSQIVKGQPQISRAQVVKNVGKNFYMKNLIALFIGTIVVVILGLVISALFPALQTELLVKLLAAAMLILVFYIFWFLPSLEPAKLK